MSRLSSRIQSVRLKYRWLFRFSAVYILICLSVLLLLLLMRAETVRITRDNVLNSQSGVITEGMYRFETFWDQAREISDCISQDAGICSLANLRDSDFKNNIPELVHAKELFKHLSSVTGDVVSFSFLTFARNDLLISDKFIDFSGESSYRSFFSFVGQDYDQWRRAIDRRGTAKTQYILPACDMSSCYFLNSSVAHNVCLLVTPICNDSFVTYCTLTLAIDSLRLERLLTGSLMENSNCHMVLLDAGGEVLLSSGSESVIPEPASVVNRQTCDYAGETYTLLTADNQYGCRIVLAIPSHIILEQAGSMNRIIYYYIVFIILLLAGLILFNLRFHAFPFSHLVQQTTVIAKQAPTLFTSPFSHISSVLSNMQNSRDTFEQKLNHLESEYSRNLLESACLRSIYTNSEIRKIEGLLNWCGLRFRIVILGTDAFHENHSWQIRTSEMLFGRVKALALNVIDGEAAYIIGADNTEEALVSAFDEIIRYLRDQGFDTKIGIGLPSDSVAGIYTSYQSARKNLISCEDAESFAELLHQTAAETGGAFSVEVHSLSSLMNMLINGDSAGITAFFGELSLRLENSTDAQITEWTHAIQIVLQETISNLPNRNALPELENAGPSVPSAERLRYLKEYALRIGELIRSRKNDSMPAIILKYIKDHCDDVNMSALTIAEHHHLSEKYVFFLIKKATGNALGTLIENERLDRACELLANTELTNDEIAKRTGFGAVNTFYRVFKKRYQQSPGSWRIQARETPKDE